MPIMSDITIVPIEVITDEDGLMIVADETLSIL
jgi:hypothetical protein